MQHAQLPASAWPVPGTADIVRSTSKVTDNVELLGLIRFDFWTAVTWRGPLTEFSADGHVQHEQWLFPQDAFVTRVCRSWQLREPMKLRYREAAARSRSFYWSIRSPTLSYLDAG